MIRFINDLVGSSTSLIPERSYESCSDSKHTARFDAGNHFCRIRSSCSAVYTTPGTVPYPISRRPSDPRVPCLILSLPLSSLPASVPPPPSSPASPSGPQYAITVAWRRVSSPPHEAALQGAPLLLFKFECPQSNRSLDVPPPALHLPTRVFEALVASQILFSVCSYTSSQEKVLHITSRSWIESQIGPLGSERPALTWLQPLRASFI
eukprot:595027-Hanusia_phi.AAC.3